MENSKPDPPREFDIKTDLRTLHIISCVLLVISFLISCILNPYLVYYYHRNKLPNLGHFFYQVLSLSNFLAILLYAPYFLWWFVTSDTPQLTHMDGFTSAVVLSLLMASSVATVYLSGAKVLALRYPFYIMSRHVKCFLKISLTLVLLSILLLELRGVVASGECFHKKPNIFPLFLITVDKSTWKIVCMSDGMEDRVKEEFEELQPPKKSGWEEGVLKPHLIVFFTTAVLGLILSGVVIWQILKIKSVQGSNSRQMSGVVTTLLLNLGIALNALFSAMELFLSLDLRELVITGLITLIFFPMLLCSFSPLVIIIRGSKIKSDLKGSFVSVRNRAEVALSLNRSI